MNAPRVGSAGVLTLKGDILACDGDEAVPVAVGLNGEVLTADSAQPTGLRWVLPAAQTDLAWRRHFLLMGG
jgi:hypothetical protein